MTKVTKLSEEQPNKKLKKIEFCVHVCANIKDENEKRCTKPLNTNSPEDWDNIVLIKKETDKKYYDLMYAYDNDGVTHSLFLGHFNDGIV